MGLFRRFSLFSWGVLVSILIGFGSVEEGGAQTVARKYKWLRKMNGALERLRNDGQRGEARVLEILAEVEGLLEEEGAQDPAWAYYKGNLALADRRRDDGEVEEEIRFLERARTGSLLLEKWNNFANVSLRLGRLLVPRGELPRARTLYEEALVHLPPEDLRRSTLYTSISTLAAFQGDWDEALALLDRAEQALGEGPDREEGRARLYGNRGQVFLEMGIPDRASLWIDRGSELAAPHADDEEWLQTRASLEIFRANLRLATERNELLERELNETLDRNDGYRKLPSVRCSLLFRLALALISRQGNGTDRDERAAKLLEEVRGDEASLATERRAAQIWLAYLDLRRGDYDRAGKRLDSVTRSKEGIDFGASMDQPLGRAFLAALEARLLRLRGAERPLLDQARDRLEGSYEGLLSVWERKDVRKGGLGFLQYDRARYAIGELVQLTLVLEPGERGVTSALSYLLRAQRLGSLSRRFGIGEVDADRVRRELLVEGEGMLLFLPALDESHVFGLDRDRVIHDLLPSGDSLSRVRKSLLDHLLRNPLELSESQNDERRTNLGRASSQLTKFLLTPKVSARLDTWSRLTVVGSDLLGYLPFEALRGRSEVWLGLEMPISYLPSLPVGIALKERRSPPRPNLVDAVFLVSPIHGDEALRRYPGIQELGMTEAEIRDLTSGYPRSRVWVAQAEDAHFGALADPRVSGAKLLHLLVHGVHHPRRERPGGLVLSETGDDQGLVWSDRVESLDPPPLVVLTACGSGRGPLRPGDPGTTDLGGAFLERGADTVILPVAHLLYEPTVQLFEIFHRRLSDGLSPAESLFQARRELASRGEWIDPHHFGLVHVRGLGHLTIFPKKPRVWGIDANVVILGSLLVALAAGLLGWRRAQGSSSVKIGSSSSG